MRHEVSEKRKCRPEVKDIRSPVLSTIPDVRKKLVFGPLGQMVTADLYLRSLPRNKHTFC